MSVTTGSRAHRARDRSHLLRPAETNALSRPRLPGEFARGLAARERRVAAECTTLQRIAGQGARPLLAPNAAGPSTSAAMPQKAAMPSLRPRPPRRDFFFV